jgi:hypothetical protein
MKSARASATKRDGTNILWKSMWGFFLFYKIYVRVEDKFGMMKMEQIHFPNLTLET